jgi:hypothetical protein
MTQTADPQGSTGDATASVGNDDSRLAKSLRKEVVLHIAVGSESARTVVTARVSRTHGRAIEAVRESCAQIQEPRRQGSRYDS